MVNYKKLFSNKKLVTMLLMLLLILVTLSTATYTWFFKGGTLLTIEFQTGYVQMNVTMSEGVDFDRDGVLDTDTTQEQYTPLYKIIDADTLANEANPVTVSGIQATSAAMRSVETIRLPAIKMKKLYPGQVYTYKFEMENQGDVESFMSLSIGAYKDQIPEDIKDLISVEAYVEGTNGAALSELNAQGPYSVLSQGKHMLCAWKDEFPLELLSGEPFIEEDSGQVDENGNPITTSKATVILKFKLETMDVIDPLLTAQGTAKENYNAYAGGTFTLSDIRVRVYSVE